MDKVRSLESKLLRDHATQRDAVDMRSTDSKVLEHADRIGGHPRCACGGELATRPACAGVVECHARERPGKLSDRDFEGSGWRSIAREHEQLRALTTNCEPHAPCRCPDARSDVESHILAT